MMLAHDMEYVCIQFIFRRIYQVKYHITTNHTAVWPRSKFQIHSVPFIIMLAEGENVCTFLVFFGVRLFVCDYN